MDDPSTLAICSPDSSPRLATIASRHIPKIIHQLWKTDKIPYRWARAVDSVKRHHSGWEYRLWTDQKINDYVEDRHPDFYSTFAGFSRNIMRADVFRYILMHDIGGLYCDLDYEFLRPYDYAGSQVVLSLECDKVYGDEHNAVANYFIASVPSHAFWRDILDELKTNPPRAESYLDVCDATGPGLVTRTFENNKKRYAGIRLTQKPVFSPQRIHGRYESKVYRNSGITYGFHYGSGTWKDRWSMSYLKLKVARFLRV